MEKKYGGPGIETATRFIVDKYEMSYADGFITVNMWDEDGRAYMASVHTDHALHMATRIRDIAVGELEAEAAEGAL